MMSLNYETLKSLETFSERYEYLNLNGVVGEDTFGYDRYLNQDFYKSQEWLDVRDDIIIRDDGCDLGIKGKKIEGVILVHHMTPITKKDIETNNPDLYNPNFLISTSLKTHNGIHYGNKEPDDMVTLERSPNDTTPWK